MQRRVLILATILLLFAVPIIHVHAQEETPTYRFTFHAFVPAKIIIIFVYSQNVTSPAVVTTDNHSSYQININTAVATTIITFSTGDVDTFKFGFSVYYPVSIIQNVEVDMMQGDQQVQDTQLFPVLGPGFSMTFTVIASPEPHYPTPQDIFNMWAGQYPTRQDFVFWTQAQNNGLDIVTNNVTWQWIFGIGALTILTAANLIPKIKESYDERKIRKETS